MLTYACVCWQMACIDTEPAAAAAAELNAAYPGANVGLAPRLDLADMDSVRDVAGWFNAQGHPLHLLVNNAGANFFQTPWFTNAGVGGCAQINFLSPYLLTRLLVRTLSSDRRCVCVCVCV